MTQTQHTAGPWVQSGVSIMSETPLRLIAVVGAPSERTDQDAFNARLIAAAPELLEALQDARYALYGNGAGNPKIDAAIAKATGAS